MGSCGFSVLLVSTFDGTLATACLDFDLHVRDGIRAVSAAVFVGVRVGAWVDFLVRIGECGVGNLSESELRGRLHGFGQEHLLQFWGELDAASARGDWRGRLRRLIFSRFPNCSARERAAAIGRRWRGGRRRHRRCGWQSDRRGREDFRRRMRRSAASRHCVPRKVGVLLVAGGQGSRLGFEHPKGMYEIGPMSKASLLQIHFEKALAAARRYGAAVPVYMMTSPVTHDEQTRVLARA